MAFVYEVNGVKVQFDHEPTDADIDEAAASLGTNKPKSNMPKPVEGEGGAAFGVYRPAGRRPESQQNREASSEMGLQTVRGIASNVPAIAGIPGSVVNAVANAPRTAQDISNRYQKAQEAFTGRAPQTQPLPEYNQVTPYDMNYFAQLTPGPQPSSPQGQLAFSAGQLAGAPIVPPVLKAAAPAVGATSRFVKDALPLVAHPIDTAMMGSEAFMRGYRNPEMMGKQGSALMPIRPTYYPHEQVSEFQAGTRGPLQMSERPTSELINTPTQKWAQNMAPVNEAGQPLVAPQGKGFEGYMENLGAGYKQDPLKGVVDAITGVGGMALTGMPTPLSAISKSVPALAARTLQKATQFEPGFDAATVQALQGRAGIEANMPSQAPALPAPTPVQPQPISMPGPQRNVNIEGQSFTLPNKIDVSNSQSASPKQKSMAIAASKIQPVQPAVPEAVPAPTPQPQVQPTQVAQPVVPEGTSQLPAERWTPEEQLKVKQAMEKPPVAKSAPTQPAKTDYKAKLLEKYGSEENVNKNATEIEKAIMRHRLNGSKFAEVSVSGGHATKLKNAMSEAENSGEKVRVTVTGKNGGYEVIYNAGQFSPDPSLTIKKTTIRSKDDVTFEGVTSEGKKFTGESKGKETIIKDEDGKIIGEYIGALKKTK